MGIDVARQRDMMEESFEAILELLAGEKPVNRTTDWFTLRDARLQLRPYSDPCFEIAVAAQVSPSGPRLAGRFGASLLSIGATNAGGFDVLGSHWTVMEERAAEFGTTADRRKWRLVGPVHIADTKEQAYEDVDVRPAAVGRLLPARRRPPARPRHRPTSAELADAMNASGFAVIGTVDDAKAQIQRLIDQSGRLRHVPHHGPRTGRPRDATWHSYELMARYVFPEFQRSAESTTASRDWAAENRPEFMNAATAAVMNAVQSHHQEKAEKAAAQSDG